MKTKENKNCRKPGELNPDQYLSRLVALKKDLHGLNGHPKIILCNNELDVHVYRGIGELAAAVGQPLRVTLRDCRDYPLELAFFYQGVRFCELKSAAALKNLTFVK